MRINKQALSRPEFRKLRGNLQVIHGTQATVAGSLLSTLAAIGELVKLVANARQVSIPQGTLFYPSIRHNNRCDKMSY